MERLKYCFNYKLIIYIIILLDIVYANLPHRKFEYIYSFKPPYLAQKDGSVPFWEYGGNAIASSENVRLAPSLRSQKGAIWTKNRINFDFFEIDIAFRISGRGRIGADGLAFWYTENKGSYDGDVFGSSDQWKGLGIIFDSFDNDNKHNNPYIMAIVNDGTKQFNHQLDGQTDMLAGCLRDFRNKPFPTRAKIEYYQNTLTVLFHSGMTNNEQDYEVCLRQENVYLPKNGYFGLSAATGGLADDHDIIHFLTTSLHPPGQIPTSTNVQYEEQQKLNQEYQDYQRKLEQQKADYKKEHPELKDPEMEDWFESDSQREVRQIFQGQNQIYEVIKDLNRKLDEIIGRQERTMSLITQGGNQIQSNQIPGQNNFGDVIRRHEVEAIFNNHNQIIGIIKEQRQFIIDLKNKADVIINTQAKQPTAQVQSVGYDTQTFIAEIRDGLNHIKQNILHTNQQQQQQQMGQNGNCPQISCVSVTSLLVIAVIQLLIILAYNIYRDSKESQAKKFY